jgi:asparagine synthase (glutamine-hydrolysing)
MCGIVGILNFQGRPLKAGQIERMADLLAHRGPDDEGYLFVNTGTGYTIARGGDSTPEDVFVSAFPYAPDESRRREGVLTFNLAMASRRLSIFDLSPGGHQPMSSEDGRVWITYNGAVYNYKELREELRRKGHRFLSGSDTEVIIKAYQEWGTDCLGKLNGMWAFCIWDSERKHLFCARDRFGIKPFYYMLDRGRLAFASEIKSLLDLDSPWTPNDGLIYDFLRSGILDHTEETFFSGIVKLPPSHFLIVDVEGKALLRKYWEIDVSDEVEGALADETYALEFAEIFRDAVRLRLRSDVPVGSCLSGGLDSSSIVCVANRLLSSGSDVSSPVRQKTFSSCFEDRRFDERRYIEEVIRWTQADKHYVFPSAEAFLDDLDAVLWHQEEPFGGTSIYAQWMVMKKARDCGITVMLDGQGGDEQLGGYRKFYIFYLLKLLGSKRLNRFVPEFFRFFSSPAVLSTLNLRSGLRYFGSGSAETGRDGLLRESFKRRFRGRETDIGYQGNLGKRIWRDLFQFSLPVLLRYEDKNSMAHSIETRLPFLDYRLVEKLASFPLTQKMRNGWTKYVLRKAMTDWVPQTILQRKTKLGFDTPEEYWFRRVLRPVVEGLFKDSPFTSDYVDSKILLNHFRRYTTRVSFHHSQFFFRFFILELWARRFGLSPRPHNVEPPV